MRKIFILLFLAIILISFMIDSKNFFKRLFEPTLPASTQNDSLQKDSLKLKPKK